MLSMLLLRRFFSDFRFLLATLFLFSPSPIFFISPPRLSSSPPHTPMPIFSHIDVAGLIDVFA